MLATPVRLGLASDPVAQDVSLVGVALLLHRVLDVFVASSQTHQRRAVRSTLPPPAGPTASIPETVPIDSRPVRRAPRSRHRRQIVMHLRVCIQRQGLARERKPVAEVERRKPRSRIVPRTLLLAARIVGVEKSLQKRPIVTGSCPLPPKITVRWKPNSKFAVGWKLNMSECTQSSLGSVCPFRLP